MASQYYQENGIKEKQADEDAEKYCCICVQYSHEQKYRP